MYIVIIYQLSSNLLLYFKIIFTDIISKLYDNIDYTHNN